MARELQGDRELRRQDADAGAVAGAPLLRLTSGPDSSWEVVEPPSRPQDRVQLRLESSAELSLPSDFHREPLNVRDIEGDLASDLYVTFERDEHDLAGILRRKGVADFNQDIVVEPKALAICSHRRHVSNEDVAAPDSLLDGDVDPDRTVAQACRLQEVEWFRDAEPIESLDRVLQRLTQGASGRAKLRLPPRG